MLISPLEDTGVCNSPSTSKESDRTVSEPADIDPADCTSVAPPDSRVRLDPEVLVTAAETVIVPLVSIRTFPAANCETKSEARMLAEAAALASKPPFKNWPPVVGESVMVIEVAKNVGVIERLVPTKESLVNVSVLAPTGMFGVNPRPVKVATPLASVFTVTDETAVPPLTRSTSAVAVTVTWYGVDPPRAFSPPVSRS
jgi:hypothetical protein